MAQGNLSEALKSLPRRPGIADRLASGPRQRRMAARSLGVLRKDRRRAGGAGQPAGGVKATATASPSATAWPAPDPSNAGWQRDLSLSLGRVADTLLKLGQQAEARPLAKRALDQLRAAIARMPDYLRLARDLPYYEDLLRRAGGTP